MAVDSTVNTHIKFKVNYSMGQNYWIKVRAVNIIGNGLNSSGVCKVNVNGMQGHRQLFRVGGLIHNFIHMCMFSVAMLTQYWVTVYMILYTYLCIAENY